MIPMPIPIPLICAEWRKVTKEFRQTKTFWPHIQAAAISAAKNPGWHPKIVQMGGKMIALDYCFDPMSGDVSWYKTAVVDDHPFLKKLPPNAPRAVRHIYTKEVRLKYMRAMDAWSFLRDMNAAEEAAMQYNRKAFDKT